MSFTSFVSKLPFCAWLKKIIETGWQTKPGRRRPSPQRSLSVEGLETRLVPATVSEIGTTLSIVLAANENLAISTSAAGVYSMNLTGGTFSDGGGIIPPTTFTGFGAANGTLTTGGVLTQISITDSGAGDSVTFNTSTAPYAEFFNIVLDDAGAGAIDFNGTSVFQNSLTAITQGATSGSVTVAAGASVTVNGDLTIVSGPNQNVALNGTLVLAAGTTNAIMAQGTGTVTFADPGIVLAGTTTVQAGGDITQTQPFTTNGTTLFNSLAGNVTLGNAGNVFSGSTGGMVTGANTFTLVNSVATQLADISMGTGALSVTSGGNITQVGVPGSNGIRTLGGPATFTVTTAASIILDSAPNDFGGGVVTFAGGALVGNQFLRDTSPLAVLGSTFVFVPPANNTSFSVTFDNASINLTSPLALGGANSNVTLVSGGDITQSGTGTITAAFVNLEVLRSGQINMPLANNASNTITFTAPDADATSFVLFTNSAALNIGTSSLGLGTFTINATGNITQSGPITQKRGAGRATFNPGANNVNLNNPGNDFEGGVTIGAGALQVTVRDISTLATFPIFPTSVTLLNVRLDNAPVALPNIDTTTAPALTNLTVRAAGIYQQPGTRIVMPNIAGSTANFDARNGANQGFPLLLNSPANDFPAVATGGVSLRNAGPNAVEIVDSTGLNFISPTTVGNGTFRVITTGGSITQAVTGTITQAANADLTTFNAGTNPITLTGNNFLTGIVILNTLSSASLTNQNQNLTLGGSVVNPFTVGGNLTVSVTGGAAITQFPGSMLTVTGKGTFTATTVTLDNVNNVFNNLVNFSGAGTVIVRDSDFNGLVLDTFAMPGGNLTVHAVGPITQASGGIIGGTATFDAGTSGINLNANNNFTGNVSLISLGTAPVVITDANSITLSDVALGSGTFTVNAGATALNSIIVNAAITQTGPGTLTFNAPFTGSSVQMLSANNEILGTIIVNSPNVSIANRGDINLTGSTITGSLNLNAAGLVTLPNTLVLSGLFTSTARQTTVVKDISAAGLSFFGSTNIANPTITPITLTATGATGITFDGDVTVGVPVILQLLANNAPVSLDEGTWSQGSNALTIKKGAAANNNSLRIGGGTNEATFNMVSGTIAFVDNTAASSFGDVVVGNRGTFAVGGTPAAETVTIDNGAGLIAFNAGSALQVGMTADGSGATDKLVKLAAATGSIQIIGTARLIGTGLAPTAASDVIDAGAGFLIGFFNLSVDPNNNNQPVDFLMGSDIARAAYGVHKLAVIQSGTEVTSFTDFNDDHDKFTITLTGGTGLVVNKDLNGDYGIVVRRASAATTLKLTTSATPGDGLTKNIAGISVNGAGAVTISAPTVDLGNVRPGEVRVQNQLAALTLHDAVAGSKIIAGGATNQSTKVTGRFFTSTNISVGGIFNLDAKQFAGGTLIAERFGTLTVSGIPTTPTVNTGDLIANLINRNAEFAPNPVAVSTVNVADRLQGNWHLNGSVGTVTAKSTVNWNLGDAPALSINNPNIGLVNNVTKLSLGVVSGSNGIHARGKVSTLEATSFVGSNNFEAGSFGTVRTTGNAAIGDVGDMTSVTLTAHGNSSGTALATLAVAGSINNSTFIADDGNFGTITAGRSISSTGFTVGHAGTTGSVSSIQAGAWTGSSLDARSLGSLKAIGNTAAALFGDFSGTVILHGVAGTTANTLGSLSARNIAGTITVENGGIGTITATRSMNTVNVSAQALAGGRIGTITAAEWLNGSLVAQSIGTLRTTGASLTAPASSFLPGDLTNVSLTLFRPAGTGIGLGTLSVAGSLTVPFIRSDNGIGTISVGRDVNGTAATSVISVNNVVASTESVGRIGSITAGRWGNTLGLSIAANSIGTVNIKGFTQTEAIGNVRFGDFQNSNVTVRGQSLTSRVGIGTFNAKGNFLNSVFVAPYGITTFTAGQGLTTSVIAVDNPDSAFTGAAGRLGTLTAGEISGGKIRANSIGTLKTTAFTSLFPYAPQLNGDVSSSSDVTATSTGTALGTFSVAGRLRDSTMNIRGSVTNITVGQNIGGSNGVQIGAALAPGAKIGTFKAAAIDITGTAPHVLDLVANSLSSLSVTGNATAGIAGSIHNSLFTITGNVGNTGIGTMTVSGTVSDSNFNVFNGNVNSVTVGAFVNSDMLVGFHFVAANDIANTTVPPGTFNATLFKLGSFKTTTPFFPSNIESASFINSNLVAGSLGTIVLTGVDGTPPPGSDTITFGVGFKQSGGAAGTVTVNGQVRQPDQPLNLGAFRYHGL